MAAVLTLVCLGGCTTGMGPRTIPPERLGYNQHIVRSSNEQLLLNLVRLRYSDTPLFLELNNVVTQYTVETRANASAVIGIDGGAGNEYGLGVGGLYAERPTVTYAPLQGEEFARRILSPIPPETILLLSQSGWSIERLLLLCAKSLNGVPNALNASGPTPAEPPVYSQFHRAAALLRSLQKSPQHAFRVQLDPEKNEFTLVANVPPSSADPLNQEWSELRGLLNLKEDQFVFKITPAWLPGSDEELAIHGRSLMAVFFLLSQSVEPPQAHLDRGLLTVTENPDGTPFDWSEVTGKLLRVHSDSARPNDAYVGVRYRGSWFYIEDTDLNSKATIGLLNLLVSLQSVSSKSASPLLTLPAGG